MIDVTCYPPTHYSYIEKYKNVKKYYYMQDASRIAIYLQDGRKITWTNTSCKIEEKK